jgi:Domain of unknown function (DUF4760)
VKLINVDGLAFFGPGSEWFWSMLQFVIVTVTLVAIYRQVKLQASSAAIEQAETLTREWNSELLSRARLAVLVALRDAQDPFRSVPAAVADIANFWERVGYLVRDGHIDATLVNEYLGNSVLNFWRYLAPTIGKFRLHDRDEGVYEHFEWLAARMAQLAGAPSAAGNPDSGAAAEDFSRGIELSLQTIQTAEELRTVIVRRASTARGDRQRPGRSPKLSPGRQSPPARAPR